MALDAKPVEDVLPARRRRRVRAVLAGFAVFIVVVSGSIWFGSAPDISSIPAPSGSSGGAPEVVYNASITPQFERAAPRLDIPVVGAGVPTVLRFGLGARRADSDLPAIRPNPAITGSADDVPLTVLLACSFCEAPRAFQGTLVYRPKDRESNVIEIPFLPSATTTGDGLLEISLFDDRSGVEYDRLVIDVAISNAAGLEPVQRNLALPSKGAEAARLAPPAADVILDVAADKNGSGNGVVTVTVTPLDPALRAALAPHALQADGSWRTFKTGLRDQKDIESISTGAHSEVTALVKQGPFLATIRRIGMGVKLPHDVERDHPFDDQQRAEVVRLFATHGQNLYAALFEHGDDSLLLAPVIAEVERFASAAPPERPLRLLIRSARVALPWQYLHPSGRSVDAERFWGMRFSLAVQRMNTGRRELAPTVQTGRTIAFLKVANVDPSVRFADQQIGQIKALAHETLVIDSREALRSAFEARGRDIGAVIGFLHASSSREVEVAANGLRSAARSTGPEIQFSPGDAINSSTLKHIDSQTPVGERPVLAAGPLVILNACETGPSTFAMEHVMLEDAMLTLGARGVLVTEAAVWIPFGHEVATRLIARLGKGEPVADAMTQVRRELLRERNNPLALLYAYHGDPALRLPQR